MKLGKLLSFISPAAGMLTGNGAGFLPYLSPGFGMLTGKGPFALGRKQGLQKGEDINVTGLASQTPDYLNPQMAEQAFLQRPMRGGMFGSGMPQMGHMGMFGGPPFGGY